MFKIYKTEIKEIYKIDELIFQDIHDLKNLEKKFIVSIYNE